jgi:hypothetical protein
MCFSMATIAFCFLVSSFFSKGVYKKVEKVAR